MLMIFILIIWLFFKLSCAQATRIYGNIVLSKLKTPYHPAFCEGGGRVAPFPVESRMKRSCNDIHLITDTTTDDAM